MTVRTRPTRVPSDLRPGVCVQTWSQFSPKRRGPMFMVLDRRDGHVYSIPVHQDPAKVKVTQTPYVDALYLIRTKSWEVKGRRTVTAHNRRVFLRRLKMDYPEEYAKVNAIIR